MYCVKCGVELDESAKKCPLCDTKVITEIRDIADVTPEPEAKSPYSDLIKIPPKAQSKFIAFIITMVMLVPTFVFSAVDVLFPMGAWPVHYAGSTLLVWIIFVFPFLWNKKPQFFVFIDAIALAGGAFFFGSVLKNDDWLVSIALPCIFVLFVFVELFVTWLFREKHEWPDVGIFVLSEIALLSIIIDALFEHYFATGWIIRYSIIISVSCALLMLFFLAAKRNKHFKAWLSRNFYY